MNKNIIKEYIAEDNMGNAIQTYNIKEILAFFTFEGKLHPSTHPGAYCGLKGTSCKHGVGNAYRFHYNDKVRLLFVLE